MAGHPDHRFRRPTVREVGDATEPFARDRIETLVRPAERMRRHQHVVHPQQRIVRRDRLLLEDVETGTGYRAVLQRRDQRGPRDRLMK